MRRACITSCRRNVPTATAVARRAAGSAAFGNIQMGPADPILGLSVAFSKDPAPTKVNLGVGVYRCDQGKPYVLPSVREAERRLTDMGLDHEYAPISGVAGFVTKAQKLAFGADAAAVADDRIASSQTLSGTGALRVAGEFMNRFYGSTSKVIAVPNPTWGNHIPVFGNAGLTVEKYSYFDPKSNRVDVPAMIADLKKMPEGTIVLLHACAHNPTGNDPTREEWREIVAAVKARKLFPLVDMAYQGFASGDPTKDAYGLRLLAEEAETLILCQSFAKSFGLYGERCGAIHFMCKDTDEKERVLSQLKILIRPMYSNPPLYGARVVDTVLGSEDLTRQWATDLHGMADRMNGVRTTLVEKLAANGSVRDWSHITEQIGMMAFTGMSKAQVARLRQEYHVYMTDDGRAAVSGLNSRNVDYVAKAFHEVSK